MPRGTAVLTSKIIIHLKDKTVKHITSET